MSTKMMALAVAAALVMSATASAQQLNRRQQEEVIGIITEVGGVCERVSETQGIAQLQNGDALMAVACTGGEQYVILVDRRARMQYYATCEELAEANDNLVRCFL